MPRYISHKGVCHPAKERIALKNLSGKVIQVDGKDVQPGDDYIYEGPDRAALFELYKAGEETFGQDFRKDPEFLKSVRAQGFNDVADYLKSMGYDEEKDNKEFNEKASVVHKREMPKRVAAIKTLGGGIDTSGEGQDRLGGFGPQPRG
ncbi:hypothetical protein LCGC14_2676740 [marine sediment metagenome]|uniref:Uncharacterized protein n=1 Tax=marine sediment metagenome TaxID=412755 RepID=A0A0F8ZMK1_9ZZZZ